MSALPEHLLRTELHFLWHEYARRLSRGDEPAALTLRDLTHQQQQLIADLLGLEKLPGSQMRLQISRLLTSCKLDRPEQLRELAERVAGPIVNRKLEREQQQRMKQRLWEWLADKLARLPFGSSELINLWIEEQRSKGVGYNKMDEQQARYRQMLLVLHRLPAQGISLAVLAADVLGDPHALDSTTSVGKLSIDAYCALNQLPRESRSYRLRRQWEWAGVALDGVSSTVLVFGLQHSVDNDMSAWLQSAAANHEPVVLTYRQICRWPLRALKSDQCAVVLENPSLIEAAADSAQEKNTIQVPIICSAGQPTLAVQTLVRQLRGAGGKVFQHADFDPAGLHITRWFQQHTGTTPWKMTDKDYLQAVREIQSPTVPLEQKIMPETPWDSGLKLSMQRHGIYVSEEQVRGELLAGIDLLKDMFHPM